MTLHLGRGTVTSIVIGCREFGNRPDSARVTSPSRVNSKATAWSRVGTLTSFAGTSIVKEPVLVSTDAIATPFGAIAWIAIDTPLNEVPSRFRSVPLTTPAEIDEAKINTTEHALAFL